MIKKFFKRVLASKSKNKKSKSKKHIRKQSVITKIQYRHYAFDILQPTETDNEINVLSYKI